jgi:hypothetical protein
VAAAHPAAIAPNRVVVMSGLSHSSQKKRRTLEQLGGGGGGNSVQPRNPEEIFYSFTEMQRIQNLSAVNANLLSILASSRDMPESDDKTGLQRLCFQGLCSNATAMSTPQQIRNPVLNDGLVCSICMEKCTFMSERGVYLDTVFTKCGHAFHVDCLNSWKTSGVANAANCPDCRASL